MPDDIAHHMRSNFANLLGQASRRFGSRDSIIYRGYATSFEELAARAGAVAAALRSAGLQPGDVCAISVRDPCDAVASYFAVLAVGGTAINVNELYRPRQIEHLLRQSRARLLLTTRDLLAEHQRTVVSDATSFLLDDVPAGGLPFEPIERDADDVAQIIFTSGSTGLPKGVVMSHANLWAGVRVVATYLGLRGDDRIASVLPLSFVYGFNQLTTALFTGATLVVERSTLVQEIVTMLRRECITVLAAVPPLWQQLLATPSFRDTPVETLRIATNAGGRLPPASVSQLRSAQPQARLFLMYGLTEVFRSTYLAPEEVDAHPDSMGRAVPESTVYVVTDDGAEAAPGEIGELVHGGPTVALGYVNDPDGTARVFRKNPFAAGDAAGPDRVVYSGDLVRRDEAGRLFYVARRDRMIKTLGFRVSPDEICDVLQASGMVAEAAVVTEPDAQRGERIVACVVLKDGAAISALRQFCGTELPRYMQPARYVSLAAIPRNGSGKHDIPALREQVTQPRESAPVGQLELPRSQTVGQHGH